jgi:hypothetical protein
MSFSDFWQRTGQNLETKVFLISQSIGPALDNSDLVVDPLDETQRNLVFLVAICLASFQLLKNRRAQPVPASGCAVRVIKIID